MQDRRGEGEEERVRDSAGGDERVEQGEGSHRRREGRSLWKAERVVGFCY